MRPVVVGSAGGNPKDIGGFFEGHADEVTQLDQFSFGFAMRSEFVEGIVDGQQLVVVARGGELHLSQIYALLTAAMTQCPLVASPVYQDAAAAKWARLAAVWRGCPRLPAVWP